MSTSSAKTRVLVQCGDKVDHISWFAATSDSSIERALRDVFGIEDTIKFVLRDEDNDVIAISPTLPHMHKFKIDFVKTAVAAVQCTPALNNSANTLQTPATANTNDDSEWNALFATAALPNRTAPTSANDTTYTHTTSMAMSPQSPRDAKQTLPFDDSLLSPVQFKRKSAPADVESESDIDGTPALAQPSPLLSVNQKPSSKASKSKSTPPLKQARLAFKPVTPIVTVDQAVAVSARLPWTCVEPMQKPLLPRYQLVKCDSSDVPSPRWGHTATRVHDKVIVFGGQDSNNTLHDVKVLDIKTGEWTTPLMGTEAAGVARTWHTATHVTYSDPPMHAVFVFGGERPRTRGNDRDEVDCIAAPMLLETDLMLWYAPSTYGKAPNGRAGHSATFVDGKVVIFGGCAGRKWLNETFTLDLARWHWSKVETLGVSPTFRSYHSATAMTIGGTSRIVVFGGNNGHRTFDCVHSLCTKTWAWTTHPCICAEGEEIAARTGHTATALDSHRILIVGGWDYSDAQSEPKRFDDAYILDINTWTWQRVYATNALGARVGHTALLLQSYAESALNSTTPVVSASKAASASPIADVWVFGGQTTDETLLNSTHVLTVAPGPHGSAL